MGTFEVKVVRIKGEDCTRIKISNKAMNLIENIKSLSDTEPVKVSKLFTYFEFKGDLINRTLRGNYGD